MLTQRNWETPPPDLGREVLELENFPVYKQQTDHTCGPCAARMVLEYLGVEVEEKQLARRCLTHPWGTLHWTVLLGYNHYARRAGYRVRMVEDHPHVFERVILNLHRGLPTTFLYAVVDQFHPPVRVMHYGNLIGVDGPEATVANANPFGVIEHMQLQEWWNRFSLLPEYMPEDQLFLIHLGPVKPRTVFLLQDR
mgnify:CR=1 FL=1